MNGVPMAIEFEEYAKNKIRSEMKMRKITTKKMCDLLDEKLNIKLKLQSFNNKILRSDFKATFFFECMYAIGVKNMQIEIDEIEFRSKEEGK